MLLMFAVFINQSRARCSERRICGSSRERAEGPAVGIAQPVTAGLGFKEHRNLRRFRGWVLSQARTQLGLNVLGHHPQVLVKLRKAKKQESELSPAPENAGQIVFNSAGEKVPGGRTRGLPPRRATMFEELGS